MMMTVLAWVSFAAMALADDDHWRGENRHDSKLYGVIEMMPKQGYEGIWRIGGNEVRVTNGTRIKQEHGRVATGKYVEVKGRHAEGGFTAYSIELEERGRTTHDLTHAKFYGSVEDMPSGGVDGIWRVNGREILVNGDTKIKEKYGVAAVGSYVEVEGNYSGETFIVYEIKVKDGKRHQEGGRHKSHKKGNHTILGTIENMPRDGYEGRWVVAGHTVEVTSSTLIDESAGKATSGGEARVTGLRSGKVINANEINITAMPQ